MMQNQKKRNDLIESRITQHKIIVVDDEEDIVLALRGLFDSIDENIETLYSTDPLEVESILKENPDVEVIITDIRMPNLSGLDLMVRVRQEHPNIKFIVMTGFSSPELRTRSYGLGAVHYIEKPFDFEALRKEVTNILSEQDESGFEGIVGSLHLAEVIQLLGLSGRKSSIKVTSGHNEGVIAIDSGNIVHARTVKNVGIDAFYEMFQWPGGKFTVGPFVRTQKTIGKPWQSLVIDAARVADEANVGIEQSHENEEETVSDDIDFVQPLETPESSAPINSPEPTIAPHAGNEDLTYSALDDLLSLPETEPTPDPHSEAKRFSFAAPLSAETIQAKTGKQPHTNPSPEPTFSIPSTAKRPPVDIDPRPVQQTNLKTPPPSSTRTEPVKKPQQPLANEAQLKRTEAETPTAKLPAPADLENVDFRLEATDVLKDYRTIERITELFVELHELAKSSWPDSSTSLPLDRIQMNKIPPRIVNWVVLLMSEDVDGTLGKMAGSFDLQDDESRTMLTNLRNHLARKRVVSAKEWMELVRRSIAYEVGLVLEPLPTLSAFCNHLLTSQTKENAIDIIISRDQLDPEFRAIVVQVITNGFSESSLASVFTETIDSMAQERRWELVERQFIRLESFLTEMGMPPSQVPIECVILRGLDEKNVAQGVEIVAYVGVNHLNLSQLESIRDKYQNKHSGS